MIRSLFGMWRGVCAWRVDATFDGRLPAAGSGLPGAGCVVAVAPHRAWLEPFLLQATWPSDAAPLVWLGDARTMTSSWWRRRLLPRLGLIPVTPGHGDPREYLGLAAEALEMGFALAIFPEKGPPSTADRTRRISPGFAYMAIRSGAPVIPVAVGGTHHIVRGSSFTVDYLHPIDVGSPLDDAFTPEGRRRAALIAASYREAVESTMRLRNAETDARSPRRERWRWLAHLFD